MKGLRIQNLSELKPCVLLVDDEVFNLEILSEILESSGYAIEKAENAQDACELLKHNPDKYQAILLDRMMPGMDGIEVLRYVKNQPQLEKIPVILQTAKTTRQDIQEGFDAGVLYYLSKPFTKDQLLAIVDTAVAGHFTQAQSSQQTAGAHHQKLHDGELQFSTIEEARNAASLLASLCPNPQRAMLGLSELFINSIEHGNLGISYQEKLNLIARGDWLNEVKRRLLLPENQDKKVEVKIHVENDAIYFDIKDDGVGFDVEKYLHFDHGQATKSHGRGIAIARTLSFDQLEYLGNGNHVRLSVKLR